MNKVLYQTSDLTLWNSCDLLSRTVRPLLAGASPSNTKVMSPLSHRMSLKSTNVVSNLLIKYQKCHFMMSWNEVMLWTIYIKCGFYDKQELSIHMQVKYNCMVKESRESFSCQGPVKT